MVNDTIHTTVSKEGDILKGCPEKVACAFIKMMEKVFCKFGFHMHWNAAYEKVDFSSILIHAARNGDFITNGSYTYKMDHNGPSGDTVLYHLHKLDMKTVDMLYKRANWYLYSFARRYRIYRRINVQLAIDFTDKVYYGEYDKRWVWKKKENERWIRAQRWIAVSFVDKDQKYVIHIEPVPVSTDKKQLLTSVLTRVFQVYNIFNARVYVDREFFNVPYIQALQEFSASHRMLWLMPAKRTPRVEQKLDLETEGVYNDFYISNRKRERAYFRLVIAQNKGEKLHAFATNFIVLTPGDLYPLYQRRWQIETNNRSIKHPFLINTTSKYMPTRDYLMRFAALCCFAWMLINALLVKEFGFNCWVPGRTFAILLVEHCSTPEKVKKVFRKAPLSARALASGSSLSFVLHIFFVLEFVLILTQINPFYF